MAARQITSIALTTLTFVVMVVVAGQHLPVDHRWHGGWIWGVAWFPVFLVLVMSCVVELKDNSSWWAWFLTLSGSYGSLLVSAIWQHQSIWLLLTQAGLMEAGALGLAYGVAVIRIGVKQRASFGEFFFPQFFGLGMLTAVLWVTTAILWQTGIITPLAIPFLIAACLIRALPMSRAFSRGYNSQYPGAQAGQKRVDRF